jgi:hypothetical protein
MRSSILCTLRYIIISDQMKDDEMGGACSAHGVDEKCAYNMGWKVCREETTRKIEA